MTKQFPEWIKTLYRGIRAGISAGLIAIWALKPDWTNLEDSLRIVTITFGTAFLVGFGKWAREYLDKRFGYDNNSLIARIFPV